MRRIDRFLRMAASWYWESAWWAGQVDEPEAAARSVVDALPPDPERDRVFWSIVEGASRPSRR